MSERETTTDGRAPDEVRKEQEADGNRLHRSYVVLTPEERAKGLVRPVRRSYRHVGSAGQRCGAVTTMSSAIAETYAREPNFYGRTFCVACVAHRPVDEFVWDGTDERVGS